MRPFPRRRPTDSLILQSLVLLVLVFAVVPLGGCGKKATAPQAPPPVVTVFNALQQTVPVFLDYVGATASVRSVDIRARVEGFLETRSFVEGDDVRQGEVVYVIDRRPFEAALQKSLAQRDEDKAETEFARLQMERYRVLAEQDFVAKSNYDDWATRYKKSQAAVEADEAQIAEDRLNLSWCTMVSPLDGRIGITYVHEGNLVGAGADTKLATIVQLDPIYVYFNPSVNDLGMIFKHMQDKASLVKIVLPGGVEHPYPGKLDFVDNQADQPTSTVKLRAVVPNPGKTLLPGLYVTARLFVMDVQGVILVPKKAVTEDQRGSFVYVVDKENKIEYRAVKVTYEYETYRVVQKGVEPGETVVIDGQQKVRPGMTVRTELSSEEKPAVPDPAGKPEQAGSGENAGGQAASPASPSQGAGKRPGG